MEVDEEDCNGSSSSQSPERATTKDRHKSSRKRKRSHGGKEDGDEPDPKKRRHYKSRRRRRHRSREKQEQHERSRSITPTLTPTPAPAPAHSCKKSEPTLTDYAMACFEFLGNNFMHENERTIFKTNALRFSQTQRKNQGKLTEETEPPLSEDETSERNAKLVKRVYEKVQSGEMATEALEDDAAAAAAATTAALCVETDPARAAAVADSDQSGDADAYRIDGVIRMRPAYELSAAIESAGGGGNDAPAKMSEQAAQSKTRRVKVSKYMSAKRSRTEALTNKAQPSSIEVYRLSVENRDVLSLKTFIQQHGAAVTSGYLQSNILFKSKPPINSIGTNPSAAANKSAASDEVGGGGGGGGGGRRIAGTLPKDEAPRSIASLRHAFLSFMVAKRPYYDRVNAAEIFDFLSKPDIEKITAKHVARMLGKPVGPFSRCCMEEQCIMRCSMTNTFDPEKNYVGRSYLTMKQYDRYVSEGPRTLPTEPGLCYICLLELYNYNVDKNRCHGHTCTDTEAPFQHICNEPGEYRTESMIQHPTGHNDGVVVPVRQLVFDEYQPCRVEEVVHDGDGRIVSYHVPSFREKSEVYFLNSSSDFQIPSVSPDAFVVCDIEPLTTESLLRKLFRNYSKPKAHIETIAFRETANANSRAWTDGITAALYGEGEIRRSRKRGYALVRTDLEGADSAEDQNHIFDGGGGGGADGGGGGDAEKESFDDQDLYERYLHIVMEVPTFRTSVTFVDMEKQWQKHASDAEGGMKLLHKLEKSRVNEAAAYASSTGKKAADYLDMCREVTKEKLYSFILHHLGHHPFDLVFASDISATERHIELLLCLFGFMVRFAHRTTAQSSDVRRTMRNAVCYPSFRLHMADAVPYEHVKTHRTYHAVHLRLNTAMLLINHKFEAHKNVSEADKYLVRKLLRFIQAHEPLVSYFSSFTFVEGSDMRYNISGMALGMDEQLGRIPDNAALDCVHADEQVVLVDATHGAYHVPQWKSVRTLLNPVTETYWEPSDYRYLSYTTERVMRQPPRMLLRHGIKHSASSHAVLQEVFDIVPRRILFGPFHDMYKWLTRECTEERAAGIVPRLEAIYKTHAEKQAAIQRQYFQRQRQQKEEQASGASSSSSSSSSSSAGVSAGAESPAMLSCASWWNPFHHRKFSRHHFPGDNKIMCALVFRVNAAYLFAERVRVMKDEALQQSLWSLAYYARLFAHTHLDLAMYMLDTGEMSDQALTSETHDPHVSTYVIHHPYDTSYFDEGCIKATSKFFSYINFISDNDTDNQPWFYLQTKIVPKCCHRRKFEEKQDEACIKSMAYYRWWLCCIVLSLMGNYRHCKVWSTFERCLQLHKHFGRSHDDFREEYMQFQVNNGYLTSNILREHAIFQIHLNGPYERAIYEAFPQWDVFKNSLYMAMDSVRAMFNTTGRLDGVDEVLKNVFGNARYVYRCGTYNFVEFILDRIRNYYQDAAKNYKKKGAGGKRGAKAKNAPPFPATLAQSLDPNCRAQFEVWDVQRMLHMNVIENTKALPRDVQEMVNEYVETLEPMQDIDLNDFRRLGLSETSIQVINHCYDLYFDEENKRAVITNLGIMASQDLELTYYIFRRIKEHYLLRVVSVSRDLAIEQERAVRRKYELEGSDDINAPLPEATYSAVFTNCCSAIKTPTAQDRAVCGTRHYGHQRCVYDHLADKYFCSAKPAKKATKKSRAAERQNGKRGLTIGDTIQASSAKNQPHASEVLRKKHGTWYKRDCHQTPVIKISALGNIIEHDDDKEKKDPHSRTICPKCGTLTLYSMAMYDINGFSCGICTQKEAEAFKNAQCCICNMVKQACRAEWTRCYMYDDHPTHGTFRMKYMYFCSKCAESANVNKCTTERTLKDASILVDKAIRTRNKYDESLHYNWRYKLYLAHEELKERDEARAKFKEQREVDPDAVY